jgi:hypothetical protein
MTLRRFAFICFIAAVLTHALAAIAGGSLDPGAWPPLLVALAIFILAPLIGLAVAVIEGAI